MMNKLFKKFLILIITLLFPFGMMTLEGVTSSSRAGANAPAWSSSAA